MQGVLADLGVSSMQFDTEGRGFSFRRDEPLDMRMDQSTGPTAADLVNQAGEEELANAIYQFGEERYSRRISRATGGGPDPSPRRASWPRWCGERCRRRAGSGSIRRRARFRRCGSGSTANWTDSIASSSDAADRLEPGGRLAVITFHSLEDRIVKHTMRGLAADAPGAFRVLTKKPMVPSDAEIDANPRARSAKLRVGEHPVAG